ncbi:MAG: hypothetical protein SOZ02_07090 [Hallerella porci]|uniref:DUF5683 domain-containing protein n=1 Tax=Hallerella porci TaxID=1945871 RepID=A0ABX5LLA4_9BACT|nr:hypothetical protein [Hallerella porci]MDY3921909.1 hypothetical protein [Hallerella porci]PWK96652.1 hypothetical protein B0H50_11636 [Hallerella porci]
MKKLLAAFLILFFSAETYAQTVISVDESISKNSSKSLPLAIGASLLLPGMGQYYLGEETFVKAYIWTDVALWVATFGSYFFGERQIANARSYASRHAGIVNPPSSESFLNLMGDYRSRGGVDGENSNPDSDEDYNQAMLRRGHAIDKDYPFDESHSWNWGSSDNPETSHRMSHFRDIMRNYRISRIAFQVSIGALILNRVISVLDVMGIYRSTSSDLAASETKRLHVFPDFRPEGPGATLLLSF